jgi:hypothetical protein
LVAGIEGQDTGQVGHDLPGIVRDGGPLQPRFVVGGIDFQDGGKIATGSGTLPEPGSLQAALHQCCDLWPAAIDGQQISSLLADPWAGCAILHA